MACDAMLNFAAMLTVCMPSRCRQLFSAVIIATASTSGASANSLLGYGTSKDAPRPGIQGCTVLQTPRAQGQLSTCGFFHAQHARAVLGMK